MHSILFSFSFPFQLGGCRSRTLLPGLWEAVYKMLNSNALLGVITDIALLTVKYKRNTQYFVHWFST